MLELKQNKQVREREWKITPKELKQTGKGKGMENHSKGIRNLGVSGKGKGKR